MTAKHEVVEYSMTYRNYVQKNNSSIQFLDGEQTKENQAPNVKSNRRSQPDDVHWKEGKIVDNLVQKTQLRYFAFDTEGG